MESPKTTKDLRLEKKRKKIKAFLEIAKLNEDDRKMNEKALTNESRFKQVEDEENCEGPCSKKTKLGAQEASSGNNSNPFAGKNLREEDVVELRRQLRERYRVLKNTPLLRLKDPVGENAQLDIEPSKRVPLFLNDLQHFILYSTLIRSSPSTPRWCQVERAVSISALKVLFIEGAGLSDYNFSKDHLHSLSNTNYPFKMELLMPSAYSGNLVQEFCAVPLSQEQCRKALYRYGSLEAAAKSFEVFKVLRAVFPVEKNQGEFAAEASSSLISSEHIGQEDMKPTLPKSDKFPRTLLLLSAWQMLDEGYPMPINSQAQQKYKDFVPTKHLYKEVSNHSPMYGVDCEMCMTTSKENECTRVSIVNEKLETILDTLVMPYNRITNYLTKFSGITAAMMEGVTTRLEDVQKFIQENIEPDAILVGQSLNFDLIALKMFHPYVIDTSIIFNITGDRYRKSKLQLLTKTFLKEDIQAQSDGHCSVEDSSASLRLVQLKLANSIAFGDEVLQCLTKIQESSGGKCKKDQVDRSSFAQSIFSFVSKASSKSLIVGMPEIIEKYVDYLDPKLTKYVQDDGSSSCLATDKDCTQLIGDGCVMCAITSQTTDVVKVMAKRALESKLCIGHVKLSEEESSQLAMGNLDVVSRLNNWVEEIDSASPINCVCMIVLCGRENASNGLCFLSLKTKKVGTFKFVPLSS